MYNVSLPWWAYALMGAGLMLFLGLLTVSVKRNHGVKRSLFASPYILWMILFTLLPCVLIAYYALTDGSGQLTLDNFRAFWDSNHIMRENMRAVAGDEVAATIPRGSVNVDTLVYSLWMAFLCTAFSLLLGYPAALFMADRHMKLGSTLVVLFIIPMWMNFLLRTYSWMTILENNGLLNQLLQKLGIIALYNHLTGSNLEYFTMIDTQGAVVLGMVYNYLPFMILPIYSVICKLDHSLLEAARDLGANTLTVFRKVILPLSLPGVLSGITMVFVPSVSTFAISRMLGGGTELLLGDLIERQFLGGAYNPQLGAAISLVMMLIVVVCMLVMNRFGEGEEQAVML